MGATFSKKWLRCPSRNGVSNRMRRTVHIGPMAQGLLRRIQARHRRKHIATVDADGVALAAIQGLNQKIEERDAKIAELVKRLSSWNNSSATGWEAINEKPQSSRWAAGRTF